MIVQNQIRCLKCGDEPFSKHGHDFVWCKCGAVAVDGGTSYLRRVGERADYEELSWSLPDDVVNKAVDAVQWARDTGRNNLGTVFAVLRVLKEHDLIRSKQ